MIVLLGIVSITAIPKMFNNNQFEQRAFFNDTLNAVRYAQKVAIATGCNTQVSIADDSYELLRGDTCASNNFISSVPHPSNGQNDYTGSQNNVSLAADHATITFDGLGRADNDTTITVGTRTITIIAATGFSFDSTP
mgnify:FL=1